MDRFAPFVVFDCNVFVQTLLSPAGSAGKCFDFAREGGVVLFVSEATLGEVRNVICRPSILSRMTGFTLDQIEAFISEILYVSQLVENVPSRFSFDHDPKDKIIIDLAIECNAEYIISWDKDLLSLMTGFDSDSKEFRQRFKSLKVVDPSEFLKRFAERELSLEP